MEAISKNLKIEKIIKLTLLTIVGTMLITISAKVKIPFYPVPMTMQTFMILFIGITYFIGPTMGYLIGFLVAVFFAGYFNYSRRLINNFIKLSFSVSFIYIFGLIWLGTLIGWDKPIFKLGAQPFLLAELFKILLLLFLTPALLKIKKLTKII